MSVYNNRTGSLLGNCKTKQQQKNYSIDNIENNLRQFNWKIDKNFLFCGVYNEPSILHQLIPLSNNIVYTIRIGNGFVYFYKVF